MGINFGHNASVGKILANLDRNTSRLSHTFERLSSGARINNSSDDPAGLALSYNLNTDAKVRNRAKANINDGISALQVVDGALDAVNSMLTRMSELGNQAANSILTSQQRKALDAEFNALDKEIRRIVDQTKFNGISLLDGELSNNSVVQITNTTGGAGTSTNTAVTNDGQFITYYDPSDGYLKQLDTINGTTLFITNQIQSTSQVVTSNGGQVIVFESTSNVTGDNAAGHNELFMYNKSSGTMSQITNALGSGEDFTALAISADGSTLAFNSKTVYSDGLGKESASTTGARDSLAVMNLNSGAIDFYNLSSLVGSTTAAAISADGSYVAFTTAKNINGGNADLSTEIFMVSTNSSAGSITQVTNTASGTAGTSLSVSNSGNLYFISTQNLSGLNPTGYSNIFEYNSSTSTLSKFTNNTVGSPISYVAISADSSYLTMFGRPNPTGGTDSTPSIWTYEFDKASWTKKTAWQGVPSASPIVSADGQSIYYATNANLTGQNADGSVEIYKLDVSPAPKQLNIETGTGSTGIISTALAGLKSAVKGLGTHTLTAYSGGAAAAAWADTTIEQLSKYRGVVGSALSRLETANRVTTAVATELEAANARIRDIDVAQETANMLRYQILQDSSTALLAQANQQPGIALQLLQSAAG